MTQRKNILKTVREQSADLAVERPRPLPNVARFMACGHDKITSVRCKIFFQLNNSRRI